MTDRMTDDTQAPVLVGVLLAGSGNVTLPRATLRGLFERKWALEDENDTLRAERDAALARAEVARAEGMQEAADMVATCCEGKWASFGFEMVEHTRAALTAPANNGEPK